MAADVDQAARPVDTEPLCHDGAENDRPRVDSRPRASTHGYCSAAVYVTEMKRVLSTACAVTALTLVTLAAPVPAIADYRDTVFATPGLVSYWRLADSGASDAVDSANLRSGIYAGTVGFGAASALNLDPNPAVSLAGGSRMIVPYESEYGTLGTIEFWMKLKSYGDTMQYRAVISRGYDVSQRNWLIALGNNATGQLTYGFGSGGAAVGRRSAATLSLNRWYHVALTRTSTGMRLYLNGALDSTLSSSATPVSSTAPIILGDDLQTTATADATYDELAVYDRALTAGQISAHYSAGTNPASFCSKVASPSGADTNAGTAASPYKTITKLSSSLPAGQTGCLRAGTYGPVNKLTLETAGVTLETYPGDATATFQGSVWLKADNVTVQRLRLDGSGSSTAEATSVTVNGSGDVIRDNDITTGDADRICIYVGTWDGLTGTSTLIERNRIHDCGAIGTNGDHGIYLNGVGTTVRNNAIYDNADRGVQMYPSATGTAVEGNTIDGNGEGVNFGGDETGPVTRNNTVSNNIISNATGRWLVEAYYPGAEPVDETGTPTNVVRGNCLYATNSVDPYYNTNNGVSPEDPDGFIASSNIMANPQFVNRAAKDFRLTGNSGCAARGAAADVAGP